MIVFVLVLYGGQQLVFTQTRNRAYRALWTLVIVPVAFAAVLAVMLLIAEAQGSRTVTPKAFLGIAMVMMSIGALVRCASAPKPSAT
jgi:hypothetical protein